MYAYLETLPQWLETTIIVIILILTIIIIIGFGYFILKIVNKINIQVAIPVMQKNPSSKSNKLIIFNNQVNS